MTRLLLLILLLTVVYSWEEFKYVVVVIFSKIRKQNKTFAAPHEQVQTDVLVADILLIATIPMSLAYLLMGSQSLPVKLFVILAELLFASLLFRGLEQYRIRREFTRHYEGADKIIAIGFSLLGFISPSWNFATRTLRSGTQMGKYLFALSLPLISGLGLAVAVRQWGLDEFTSRLDLLIVIAVLGIMLNIAIEVMEHMFKTHRLRLSGFMRIALGLVIIFVLQANIF